MDRIDAAISWLTEQTRLSFRIMETNSQLLKFLGHPVLKEIRYRTLQWFIQVTETSKLLPETRDTAIHLYDMYLAHILSKEGMIVTDRREYLSAVACTCMIISSKIHDSRPLMPCNFNRHSSDVLLSTESEILSACGCNILSQGSSVVIIEHLLELLPPSHERKDDFDSELWIDSAKRMTLQILNSFMLTTEALYFTPTTIAMSALLLSFSKLGVDLMVWLRRIPDVCLPRRDHPFFKTDQLAFLDADACIKQLLKYQSFNDRNVLEPSPPDVATTKLDSDDNCSNSNSQMTVETDTPCENKELTVLVESNAVKKPWPERRSPTGVCAITEGTSTHNEYRSISPRGDMDWSNCNGDKKPHVTNTNMHEEWCVTNSGAEIHVARGSPIQFDGTQPQPHLLA
jgi:hypothetical protein